MIAFDRKSERELENENRKTDAYGLAVCCR